MRKKAKTPPPTGSQFLVYRTEDGKLKIDVRFEGDTVLLSTRRTGCPLAPFLTQVWVAADTQQQLLDRLSVLERVVFNCP